MARKIKKSQNIDNATRAQESSETAAPTPGPAKLAKFSTRRLRRGRLEDLPKMPLDIVFEVFSHLEPLDLLHLARTNKEFRSVLMSRQNVGFWKASWRNVEGLPECPEGVSHPALVNLIFCSNCHECLKVNSKWILWDHRARYCKRCRDRLYNENRSYYYYARVENNTVEQVFTSSLEVDPALRDMKIFKVCRMWTERSFRQLEDGSDAYPYDACILTSDIEDLKSKVTNMTVEARSLYLTEQMTFLERWRKHVFLLQNWYGARKETRSEELSGLRDSRCASIMQKLKELGWGDEFAGMSYVDKTKFNRLSAVRQSRALTDRGWKKIAPSIIEFMEKVKTERLDEERKRRLRERFYAFDRALPKLYDYRPGEPTELDLALGIPELREVIDSPAGEQIDEHGFNFLVEKGVLEAFSDRWKKNRNAYLARLVSEKIKNLDPGVDPLSLAVASRFNCRNCGERACCPQVHRCDCSWSYKRGPELQEDDIYGKVACDTLSKRYWAPSFTTLVDSLTQVVEKCGFDPMRATVEDLNNCPVRFTCKACSDRKGIAVMTWYAAYLHHTNSYGDCKAQDIYVVDDKRTKATREVEQSYIVDKLRSSGPSSYYMCSHCSQRNSYERVKATITDHMKTQHQIDEPSEGADYWPILAAAWEPSNHNAVVYLVPEQKKDSPGSLTYCEKNAIERGNAVYFNFDPPAPTP